MIMAGIGFQELLIIFLIIALLFGAKKIPELARGLGQAMKEFKKGMKDEPEKEKNSKSPDSELKYEKSESSDLKTTESEEKIKVSDIKQN
jgi:twin arginine-targeting protein translocase, TatA/E family